MSRVQEASRRIRVAATGDIHASGLQRDEVTASFASAAEACDLLLLAGDLTEYGQADEAEVVADACRGLPVPVVAVLGNHDWHSDRAADVTAILAEAGVIVLERASTILQVDGTAVGVAGVKGFVGGFGTQWANFGEPLFREAYAETTADVQGLDAGLRAIASCPVRIALLHYAPTAATLAGEPERLWLVLGAERLATPIAEHRPDIVLHGHAHAGSFSGAIGEVPVYNVAVHVTGKDFSVFELDASPA
jgi:Icc-related predicted phosphoesterase